MAGWDPWQRIAEMEVERMHAEAEAARRAKAEEESPDVYDLAQQHMRALYNRAPDIGPVQRPAAEAKMTRDEFDAGLDPRDLAAAKALAAERLAETRYERCVAVDCRPRPWRWPEWASCALGWAVTLGLQSAFLASNPGRFEDREGIVFGAVMGFLGVVCGDEADRAIRRWPRDRRESA